MTIRLREVDYKRMMNDKKANLLFLYNLPGNRNITQTSRMELLVG